MEAGATMLREFFEKADPPPLTRQRVIAAYTVAITVDLLQLALGPAGWLFADEILDVVATILTWRLLGFHPVLLPTFVLEFLPVSDMLPTWTGCVTIVLALRKRREARSGNDTSLPPGRVIDIKGRPQP